MSRSVRLRGELSGWGRSALDRSVLRPRGGSPAPRAFRGFGAFGHTGAAGVLRTVARVPPAAQVAHSIAAVRWYVLTYDLVPDYLERRPPLREEHLRLAREAHERGELALAGAYADPADAAVFVWHTADPAAVERFVAADPYVKNGLVTGWRLRPWTVVIGGGG